MIDKIRMITYSQKKYYLMEMREVVIHHILILNKQTVYQDQVFRNSVLTNIFDLSKICPFILKKEMNKQNIFDFDIHYR